MYRSDAPAPVPFAATAEQPSKPASTPEPEAPAAPAPGAAHRVAGWIEAGVGIMMLPFTLAIVVMVAPVLWVFGTRSRD